MTVPIAHADLPLWYRPPPAYRRVLKQNLVEVLPWAFLQTDECLERRAGLRDRYPTRDLVPFARRVDCDDLACWESGSLDRVVVVHDFASPGWEGCDGFENFWAWFHGVIDDMADYEP